MSFHACILCSLAMDACGLFIVGAERKGCEIIQEWYNNFILLCHPPVFSGGTFLLLCCSSCGLVVELFSVGLTRLLARPT